MTYFLSFQGGPLDSHIHEKLSPPPFISWDNATRFRDSAIFKRD